MFLVLGLMIALVCIIIMYGLNDVYGALWDETGDTESGCVITKSDILIITKANDKCQKWVEIFANYGYNITEVSPPDFWSPGSVVMQK